MDRPTCLVGYAVILMASLVSNVVDKRAGKIDRVHQNIKRKAVAQLSHPSRNQQMMKPDKQENGDEAVGHESIDERGRHQTTRKARSRDPPGTERGEEL